MDNGPWIFGGQDGQTFETFGLPASLHPLLEWASRLRLTRPLLAVLDASKTGINPEYVGSITVEDCIIMGRRIRVGC